MIIAVVGSGGKTTLIKKLAAQYQSEGKTVLITTTTHMFVEPDTLLTDDAQSILLALEQRGCVMAGIPKGEKIGPLSKETFAALCPYADVVLVEADGSKQFPIKYPNETEPVIPENTEQIILVWGPQGLNRPAREVCHRLELVMQCLGIEENTPITKAHVKKLLEEGYRKPLSRQYPGVKLQIYPPL